MSSSWMTSFTANPRPYPKPCGAIPNNRVEWERLHRRSPHPRSLGSQEMKRWLSPNVRANVLREASIEITNLDIDQLAPRDSPASVAPGRIIWTEWRSVTWPPFKKMGRLAGSSLGNRDLRSTAGPVLSAVTKISELNTVQNSQFESTYFCAIGIRRPTPNARLVTFSPGAACSLLYSFRSTRRCTQRTVFASNPWVTMSRALKFSST